MCRVSRALSGAVVGDGHLACCADLRAAGRPPDILSKRNRRKRTFVKRTKEIASFGNSTKVTVLIFFHSEVCVGMKSSESSVSDRFVWDLQ